MPAWYDIKSLGKDRIHDPAEGIDASVARIRKLIDDEGAKGIPPSKIVLAGFSQGGAMALFTGLNLDERVAGILCMSGYLVNPARVAPTASSRGTPVYMLHGEDDPLVLPEYARESAAKLRELGVGEVTLKMYAGLPHSANMEELADAAAFLRRVLK